MSAVKSNMKSNERNILLKKYVERNVEEMKKMNERKKMKIPCTTIMCPYCQNNV
jgi:hypothetical protein